MNAPASPRLLGSPRSGALTESGPPVRGGTLELVARRVQRLRSSGDDSAYVISSLWLVQTFARQQLAYPPGPDNAFKTRPVANLALEVPTPENGGTSADGLSYIFHLRRGVLGNSHPPREVTAHDVVRAFKLFCNPVSPVGAPTYYMGTIAGDGRLLRTVRACARHGGRHRRFRDYA